MRAHGVTIGPDESIYCTDDGDHTVRKCTYDGKVLLELGVPGQAAAMHSGKPFNRCTHIALCPDTGAIYVADGYGNSCVHKYDPNGKLLFSWGEAGTDPGQFNIVHNICTDKEGYVYVADRENHRVQVFDRNGKYETAWSNVHRPCGLFMDSGRRRTVLHRRAGLGHGGERHAPEPRPAHRHPQPQGRGPHAAGR